MERERSFRTLTRAEARQAMQVAKRYHSGEISLPPYIVQQKKLIEAKTRNAELFMARTGAIDYNMVYEVVDLKLELDTMYVRWTQDASA